jgi:hypothetical protein
MAERGAAGDMPKGDEFEKARDLMPRGRRDAMPAAPAGSGGGPNGPMPAKFNPVLGGAGVAAMAQAAKAGELFQYAIEQPVSIERQKSAMIPIVNQEVEAQKVSIYNESVQPRFPLNGLRLKNTTPLHLMQGPVTVFDGGVYAGDARIEDLQPKEERLIAYAMDLAVEVEPQHKGGASEITSVKIVKGTLIATHKSLREKTYHVKNRSDEKRILLIEHPFDSSWKLVSPEQTAERTQTVYRFRVEVEPRKSASLDVKEERVSSQQIALIHYDVDAILFYVGSKVLSAKAREALQKVVGMKMKLNDITSRRAEAQQEINNIGAEQARIRENMERLERHSELYARYVKKFDQQETQIESLRELIKKLTEDEGKQRKQLEEYLANLQVD